MQRVCVPDRREEPGRRGQAGRQHSRPPTASEERRPALLACAVQDLGLGRQTGSRAGWAPPLPPARTYTCTHMLSHSESCTHTHSHTRPSRQQRHQAPIQLQEAPSPLDAERVFKWWLVGAAQPRRRRWSPEPPGALAETWQEGSPILWAFRAKEAGAGEEHPVEGCSPQATGGACGKLAERVTGIGRHSRKQDDGLATSCRTRARDWCTQTQEGCRLQRAGRWR